MKEFKAGDGKRDELSVGFWQCNTHVQCTYTRQKDPNQKRNASP